MVLFQVRLERLGQLQLIYIIVLYFTNDACPAQMLQREAEVAVQRQREHRFEEHATAGVLVVLDEAADGVGGEDARVVRVEAELVVPLLDAGVQGAAVFAERHAE